MYVLLANTVLSIHVAFVAFVVLLVPLIYIGRAMRWRWVRVFWLRAVHLAGIGVVVAQAWFGVICPLTTLEMWLREQAELSTYTGSFIEHWLQQVIYWDFPAWVFILVYTLFAALVVLSWHAVPPEKRSHRDALSA